VTLRVEVPMDWMLIPQIIAVVLIVLLIPFVLGKHRDSSTPGKFPGEVRNDKSIAVAGWSEEEIHQILTNFDEAYDWSDYQPRRSELEKGKSTEYRLTFPHDIHPEMLVALVNFLAYPEGLNSHGRKISVAATTTITEGFEEIDSAHWGKNAVLYIPDADSSHKAVYLETEDGMVFSCRLPGCVWNPAGDARMPAEIDALLDGTLNEPMIIREPDR
jgi:hypothetical protein